MVDTRYEQLVQPTALVNVNRFFGWPRKNRYGCPIASDRWRSVGEVERLLGAEVGRDFRQAAAVFIRESRSSLLGRDIIDTSNGDPNTRMESDDE